MLALAEELLLAGRVTYIEEIGRRGRERSERRALIVISSVSAPTPRDSRHVVVTVRSDSLRIATHGYDQCG